MKPFFKTFFIFYKFIFNSTLHLARKGRISSWTLSIASRAKNLTSLHQSSKIPWKRVIQELSIIHFSWLLFTAWHSRKYSNCLSLAWSWVDIDIFNQATKVSEGVTKLFPKGFDRQNSIFLDPHGKRKPATELHSSALNFQSSRANFLHFFQEKP